MPVILYLVLNILVCVYGKWKRFFFIITAMWPEYLAHGLIKKNFTDSEGASVGALGPAEFDSEGWKGTIPPPYPPFKEEDVKFQLFTR